MGLTVGNPAVVTDQTGMSSYIRSSKNGWTIISESEPISTNNPPIRYIYTCRETWRKPSLKSLIGTLKFAKNNLTNEIKKNAMESAK